MKNCISLLLLVATLFLPCLKVNAQVSADFSINYQFPNCSPTVITFVNNSTGVAPLTYQWDFGIPGSTSTFLNPSTTYATCGTYTVKLTVTNGKGQTSTISKQVITNCNPVANFTTVGGQGCAPVSASFKSTSLTGSGTIVKYVWDFGDGYMGTDSNPSHIFTTPGCKTVTLVITNSNGCVSDTTYKNIVCPASSPVADFTSSNPVSCYAPLNVSYTPAINGGTPPYNYQWNFSGGAPTTAGYANPSINYGTAGFYNTQMIVGDANGCKDTVKKIDYVQIGNNTVDYYVSSLSGCAPLQVYLSSNADSHLTNANWSAPGSTDTVGNSFYEFLTSYIVGGTYQVCYNATFQGGCVASKCTTIVVGNTPVAGFTVSGNNLTCEPPIKNVIYTNTSTGIGTFNYQWFFSGGTPSSSNLQNPPPISYYSCGNYGTMLVVSNLQGCSDTMRMDSVVNINCPVASITVSGKSGCVPYDVSFNSTGSTGMPVKWWWNFGDTANPDSVQSTQQNPSHTYTKANTFFNVRLIIQNALGCRDTVIYKSFIVAGVRPKAIFTATPTTVCASMPVSFKNLSTGISSITQYSWDFMGGPPYVAMSKQASPSYTYQDTGIFNVSLIVSNNGCADTVKIPHLIKVNPPIAKIVVTHSSNCANIYDVTLDGTTSIGADTYSWSIPGGSPSTSNSSTVEVHFNALGTFTATLTVTNKETGCSYTTNQAVNIVNVKADFSMPVSSGCSLFTACFTNLSVDGNTYQWSVLDQNGVTQFSEGREQPYCFNIRTPGYYTVVLTATDVNGCSNTIKKPNFITVYGLSPNFGYSSGEGCGPLTVNFTDKTQSSNVSFPVSWNWDFGDPSSGSNNHSTLQNPTHIYNSDGSFQIVLAVTDNHGCVSTVTTNTDGVVVSKPSVNFFSSDSTVCLGNPICFTNLTSSVVGDFFFTWNFGDNSPLSQVPNPCYTYADTGWYSVKLISKNYWGCADSMLKTKYIHVITPVAAFVADTLSASCPPLQVHFKNMSDGSDTATKWLWSFGDGSTATGKNPFHIYTYAGQFDVTLKMSTSNGCNNTITYNNYINITGPRAKVKITSETGCAPLTTCFSAKSNNTTEYIWNFGDGSVLLAGPDSVCYNYSKQGIYHPQLILNDGLGCVYSFPLDTITVSQPVAGFKIIPPSMCSGETAVFTDTSHAFVKIKNWNWNFGDPLSGINNSSGIQNPNHRYATPDSFTVQLTITDTFGCTSLATNTEIVHPNPKALFTSNVSAICPMGTVQFSNISVVSDSIGSSSWNFGDATSGASNVSLVQNPSHTFNAPGTYTVKLLITSIYGCSDSVINYILVRNNPVAGAGPNKSICLNNSTTLNGTGGQNYSWSPSANLSINDSASVIATPASTTTYTLFVTDAYGCTATGTVIITVNQLPVINAGTTQSVCQGLSTTLQASGAISYTWSPSSGLNNASVQSPKASPLVTTTYTVSGADGNGCKNIGSVILIVHALPVANAGPDVAICLNTSTQLNASGGISYNWTPAASLSNPAIANPQAFPTATTNYVVAVTDTNNCTADATVQVVVNSLPKISAGPDRTLCYGTSIMLNATGGVKYQWSPPSSINDTGVANPVADPIINTQYVVTGFDNIGCHARDSLNVTVIQPLVAKVNPNVEVCAQSVVQLSASGGQIYQWSPPQGLDNPMVADPFASPAQSTNYQVIISDGMCFVDTQDVSVKVLSLPAVNAGQDVMILSGGSVQLNANGTSNTYSWFPSTGLSCTNCQDPLASPLETTSYVVVCTNINGCNASDTIIVRVGCTEDVMFIPNAFTPNGDGQNDIFYVRSKGLSSMTYIRIYDRWGEMVYESSNMEEGWDGTYKGKPVQQGVYVYYAEGICANGQKIERQGNVTLIR